MKRIMIIAGEASGDLHAAKLVQSVLDRSPSIQFFGIGGQQMRKAGVDILVDSADLAVVGLVEVLAHRKVIFGALNRMRDILRTDPPDLLILTDYPEFNLRLAKSAKEGGVKVLYYISPQIWAWRQGRVKKIKQCVDMMAVVFPFEVDFYTQYQVPVRFVGHPLANEVHASANRESLHREFKLDSAKPVIGLFPGSRRSEIKRLLPIILDSAKLLNKDSPAIQFLLPVASTLNNDIFESYLNDRALPIKLIPGRSYDVMQACDAIVTVSGTVTLEIALIGTPMVIINKLALLSYMLVKRMLKINHIGLCNIIAGHEIAPELVQYDARPELIAGLLKKMLNEPEYTAVMRQQLSEVKGILESTEQTTDIAELTLEMLN